MSALQQALFGGGGIVTGQQAYTTAGTYSWVAPAGVTSVSAVVVSRGAAGYAYLPCEWVRVGGRGGTLAYKNNISVTPGSSYSVVVGQSGFPQSSFVDSSTVYAQTGCAPVGDGGGMGGNGGYIGNYNSCYPTSGVGGGGAGGYSGAGGSVGASGSGGGGGGGTDGSTGTGGGGVGLLGEGASGGVNGGGSGGANSSGTTGGAYGGGSASGPSNNCGSEVFTTPGGAAVRIIWPGNTRSFPSTNTGDL